MTREEIESKLEKLEMTDRYFGYDMPNNDRYEMLQEMESLKEQLSEMDEQEADNDDHESCFEEQYENEDFAMDGDYHNMEYDGDTGCWGS